MSNPAATGISDHGGGLSPVIADASGYGYRVRFDMVRVDYDTFERTRKGRATRHACLAGTDRITD